MKKTYYKPQIKIYIPRLERFMGNNTNQEQTTPNWGGTSDSGGEATDWGGGNTKSYFNVWEEQI